MTVEGINLEEKWLRLREQNHPGDHRLRVHNEIDIDASIQQPEGTLGLVLEYDVDAKLDHEDLSGSRDVSLEHSLYEGRHTLRISLLDARSEPMFTTLCEHIIKKVATQTTSQARAQALVLYFNQWQQFLRRSSINGMNAERQRGLYGELVTLQTLLIPAVGPQHALDAWTGPDRKPQDFQISEIAIETKTMVQSEPQQLHIHNERQLDDFGLAALLIAHHRIVQHDGAGQTLPELVDEVTELVKANGGDIQRFESKLLKAGYADFQREKYDKTGYSLKTTSYYHVRDNFPKITETSLDSGIGDVHYKLDASACQEFAVSHDRVTDWLSEPPEPIVPSETRESDLVEYKQTAWTPMSETKNDQQRADVIKELKTEVIKTVVGFLNCDGGQLVIGVHDKTLEITGIEVDLEELGKDPKNIDLYEQRITELLRNHIDDNVLSCIRISFSGEDKTACHIRVRPSFKPRWGNPPVQSGEQKKLVFWVRQTNGTYPLEGESMIAHIQEMQRR